MRPLGGSEPSCPLPAPHPGLCNRTGRGKTAVCLSPPLLPGEGGNAQRPPFPNASTEAPEGGPAHPDPHLRMLCLRSVPSLSFLPRASVWGGLLMGDPLRAPLVVSLLTAHPLAPTPRGTLADFVFPVLCNALLKHPPHYSLPLLLPHVYIVGGVPGRLPPPRLLYIFVT
uniref:Uncharacterized protein n=1 Tax=Sphaerodactylus townsendi TaxID=933632 RepID=A0ACB8EXP4_9SAUR